MKATSVFLGILLVGTNAWWFYQAIDQAVTNKYRDQERYETANRVVALSAIASEAVKSRPKSEVEALLRRVLPDEQPFEKDGALHTTWVSMPQSPDGLVLRVAVDPGTLQAASPSPATSK
ncbi:hypothetical protein HLB44_36515 [Aquincola sp. S2]|uniref:Uncharacterized protein n=1 Tax=Pseudaquabacterium terrae TaxID=2732868 RepID=A0ABX2EUX9_9BURK|nr:hypothetical protein [Aquabacterium terrae]NRF72468.1 hypothetical protein [Aquabacterium terrae]